MRRLAFLVVVCFACSLLSCSQQSAQAPLPTASASREGVSEVPAQLASWTSTPTSRAEPSVQPPTATSKPRLSARPSASATPAPSVSPPPATAEPTLPPLSKPMEGRPLDVSIEQLLSANGHLTAGVTARMDGKATHLLASLGRSVYALSGAGGIKWQARTTGPVYAIAALGGDRIAVGDDAGHVDLLDAGGRRTGRQEFGSRVTALEAWQGGLLVAGWDERLTLLDREGRQVVWQAEVEGPVGYLGTLPDLAVVATLGGVLKAFDVGGRPVWESDVGAPVGSLGTVRLGAGGRILVGVQDSRLLALGADGNVLWQRTMGDGFGGTPVWQAAELAGDEELVIIAGTGGDDPTLALLSVDGRVFWRIPVPAPIGALAAVDLDGDGVEEVLAGLASSQILVFDREGRERGAVHAGLGVTGLEPEGNAVLVRADVVAWRLEARPGQTGGSWLPPPALISPSSDSIDSALEDVSRQVSDGEAVLVFVGDVGLGRTMEANLARYGPDYPWTGWGRLVPGADLAIANLEGVLTRQGRPLDKSYLIRAHPYWGETLEVGGFDLVTLANNHALDFGQEGLNETVDTMRATGIAVVGAGRTAQDARRPALYDLNGVRVAVLGYAAERWNGSEDVPETDRIAWADPRLVDEDVRAVRDGSDLVVVLLHAGSEYASKPSADQVAVAHAAIDAGADLVVGHHPHVTQTVERYAGGLVVYSLGDAVFDIPRRIAMRGHLLRVTAGQEGLIGAELWPFWIEDAIRPRLLDDGQGNPKVKVIYP